MNLNFRRYAEICKVEPQDDGTIKVYGYASSGAVDSDGEIVKPEAIKAALPDYMKFGAVREMHQPSAAGTAIEASVEDDGKTFFGAHIVDPVAVKKVGAGVYKGFSIGGKVLKRNAENKAIIEEIKLIEVSLVDRPANPEAVFTTYKAEGVDAEDPPPAEEPAPDAEAAKADVAKADREAIEGISGILNKGELSPQSLLAAAQAAIAKAAQQPLTREQLQKGMYTVGCFADLLQSIASLTDGTEWEAQWEGDNSPIPAQLRDWLTQGARIFAEMAAEEVSELLASVKKPDAMPDVEVVAAADTSADVTKAGAKFSSDTKDALAAIHQCVKDACAKMDALGYDKKPDGEDKTDDDAAMAAGPGDMLKAATLAADSAMKAELAKRDEQIGELLKRIKTLEDQPLPAKGVTKAVVVDKAQDDPGARPADYVDPVLKADGTVDEAATAFKKSFRNPISMGFRPPLTNQ